LIRIKAHLLEDKQISSVRVYDEAEKEPLLKGLLSPDSNLFDQILPYRFFCHFRYFWSEFWKRKHFGRFWSIKVKKTAKS
jgi:hypothetical protein